MSRPDWNEFTSFERRLCRRNRFLGGGFGRGAKPPSEQIIDAPNWIVSAFLPESIFV